MARPKSKKELLNLGKSNFDKLLELVDSFNVSEQNSAFPTGTMNRNISDVLAHLHHWHLLMMKWHDVGMAGEKPEMPDKGYSWKTTPALNRWIWEKYNKNTLNNSRKLVQKSFQQVRGLISTYNDTELFEKKRYKWTGSTSLGSYLVSATSSHYDWAYKLIKKAKKNSLTAA